MKHKFIISILSCCVVALGLTSCKDFLEQENPNNLTTTSFWQSLADCDQGLTAVYNSFKDVNIYLTVEDSNRADITWPGANPKFPTTTNVFYGHQFNESTAQVKNKWATLYRGIFRANQVIEGLNGIKAEMSSSSDLLDWDQMMGQAVFFRGLFHFYLYCSFNEGNVPIVSEVPMSESEYYRECNPRSEVEAFVRSDMVLAESLLPQKGAANGWTDSEKGRVYSEAATAILGLTYLYENEPAYLDPDKKPNYAEAAKYFKKIIDNAQFSLAAVDENFTTKGEFNSESILEINYTRDANADLSGESVLSCNLANKIGPKDCITNATQMVPSYWLYRLYAKEPIEPKDETNYTLLKTDYHGDIYHYNRTDDAFFYTEVNASNRTLSYWVVKPYDKLKMGTSVNATGLKNGFDTGSDNKNAYYVFKKNLKILDPITRIPTDAHKELDYSSNDQKNLYVFHHNGTVGVPPCRPFKGLRGDGTWIAQILNQDGTWSDFDNTYIESMDAGNVTPETYYDDDNPNPKHYYRRLRTNSQRASNSVVLMTDEDMPLYGKYNAITRTSFQNVWAYYRKYTNWDTRENEDDLLKSDSDINFRLIRLADIYLMYAECLVEGGSSSAGVGEAIKYINLVRRRAGTILIGENDGLNPDCTYQGDLANTDLYDMAEYDSDFGTVVDNAQKVMKHLMYVERPLELAIEGHAIRQIDLRRWNVTADRFADLAKRPFTQKTFLGVDVDYNSSARKTIIPYSFDIDPDDDYYDQNAEKKYEFTVPRNNYIAEEHAYYPIPRDESSSNPSIMMLK